VSVAPPQVVVVGGGIAGLATAFYVERALERRGMPGEVTVLEAGPRLGGNIQSEAADGFLVEWGPNGFLDNAPSTLSLARDLGLDAQVVKADPRAAVRYLWRNGRLHELPTGLWSLLKSQVLSPWGRVRILLEPFQPTGPADRDESVRAFGVRRIGREAADTLVDAMVSGVFAGDAETLSLASAFPKMRAMESEHGSLVKAMIARRKSRAGGPAGPGGTLTSFRDGMETLPRALGRHLTGRVRTRAPVTGLTRSASTAPWTVHVEGAADITADHIVLAVPAPMAGTVVEGVSPELADVLRTMPTAGLAVVTLGYPESALAGVPDGFGFLVPRSEGLRILGCLRDSTIFSGRAPHGQALLRVMIGGAHDPEAVRLSDPALLEIVRRELTTTLGVVAEPTLVRIFRHPLGISQYTLGHRGRLSSVQEILGTLPGLTLSGSSYLGVSMNACIENAAREAEEVATNLTRGGSVFAAASTPEPQYSA